MKIQIRFNTDKEKLDPNAPAWRVLIEGEEHLAEKVEIMVPTWTSEDPLPDGRKKWLLSCEGKVHWFGKGCKITF